MARVAEAEARVTVNVDTSAVDAAMGKLDALEAKIDSLNGKKITLSVDSGSLKTLSNSLGKAVSGSVSGAMTEGARSGANTVAKTTSKNPVQIATTLGAQLETTAKEAQQIQNQTQALIENNNKNQQEEQKLTRKEPAQIGTTAKPNDDVIDVVATEAEDQAQITDRMSRANQTLQKAFQQQIDEISRNNAIVREAEEIHREAGIVDVQEHRDSYGRIIPSTDPLTGEKKRAYTSSAISNNLLDNLKAVRDQFKDMEGMADARYSVNGKEYDIDGAIQVLEEEQAATKGFVNQATQKLKKDYRAREDVGDLSTQDNYIKDATKSWTGALDDATQEVNQIVQSAKRSEPAKSETEESAKSTESKAEESKPAPSSTKTTASEKAAQTETESAQSQVVRDTKDIAKAKAKAQQYLEDEGQFLVEEYQNRIDQLGTLDKGFTKAKSDFTKAKYGEAYGQVLDELDEFSQIAQATPGFSQHKFKLGDSSEPVTWDEAITQLREKNQTQRSGYDTSKLTRAKRQQLESGSALLAQSSTSPLSDEAENIRFNVGKMKGELGEQIVSDIFSPIETAVEKTRTASAQKGIREQATQFLNDLVYGTTRVTLTGDSFGDLTRLDYQLSKVQLLKDNLSALKKIPGLDEQEFETNDLRLDQPKTVKGLDNLVNYLDNYVKGHPAYNLSGEDLDRLAKGYDDIEYMDDLEFYGSLKKARSEDLDDILSANAKVSEKSISTIGNKRLNKDIYPAEKMTAETAEKVVGTANSLLDDTVSTIQSTFDSVARHAEVINNQKTSRKEAAGHYDVADSELAELAASQALRNVPGINEAEFEVNGRKYSLDQAINAATRSIQKGKPKSSNDKVLDSEEYQAVQDEFNAESKQVKGALQSVAKRAQDFEQNQLEYYNTLDKYQNNKPLYAQERMAEHLQGLDDQITKEYQTRLGQLEEYRQAAETAPTAYERYKNKLAYAQTAEYLDKYADVALSERGQNGVKNVYGYGATDPDDPYAFLNESIRSRAAQYRNDLENSKLPTAAIRKAQSEVADLFGENKLSGLITNLGESANKYNKYLNENFPESENFRYDDTRKNYVKLQEREAAQAQTRSNEPTYSKSDITAEGKKAARDLLQGSTSEILNKATAQVQKVMDTVAQRAMEFESTDKPISHSRALVNDQLSWNDLSNITNEKFAQAVRQIPGFMEHEFEFMGQKLKYEDLFSAGVEATRSGLSDDMVPSFQDQAIRGRQFHQFDDDLESVYWDTQQYLQDFNAVAAQESLRIKQQQKETKAQQQQAKTTTTAPSTTSESEKAAQTKTTSKPTQETKSSTQKALDETANSLLDRATEQVQSLMDSVAGHAKRMNARKNKPSADELLALEDLSMRELDAINPSFGNYKALAQIPGMMDQEFTFRGKTYKFNELYGAGRKATKARIGFDSVVGGMNQRDNLINEGQKYTEQFADEKAGIQSGISSLVKDTKQYLNDKAAADKEQTAQRTKAAEAEEEAAKTRESTAKQEEETTQQRQRVTQQEKETQQQQEQTQREQQQTQQEQEQLIQQQARQQESQQSHAEQEVKQPEPEKAAEPTPEPDVSEAAAAESNATLEGAAQSLNTAASNLNEAAANLNQSASTLASAAEGKGTDVDTEGGGATTASKQSSTQAVSAKESETAIAQQSSKPASSEGEQSLLYSRTTEPSESTQAITTKTGEDLNNNLIALDQSVAQDTQATQEHAEVIEDAEVVESSEVETTPAEAIPVTPVAQLETNLDNLSDATESAAQAQTEQAAQVKEETAQVKQVTSNFGRGREGIGPASLKDLVADAYADTWNNYISQRDAMKASGATNEELYKLTESAHQQIQAINKTVAKARRENPDIFEGVEVTTAEGVTKGIGGEGSVGDYFNRQLKKQANQRSKLTKEEREALKAEIENPVAGTSAETFINAAESRIPYLRQEREEAAKVAEQQQEVNRARAEGLQSQKDWLASEQVRQSVAERNNQVETDAMEASRKQYFDTWGSRPNQNSSSSPTGSPVRQGNIALNEDFGEALQAWENQHGAKVKPETFAKKLNDAGELIGVTAKNISTDFDNTAAFMLRDAEKAQGKEQAIRMDGATEFVEGLGDKTAAGIQLRDKNMRLLDDGVIPAELMQATGIFDNEKLMENYIKGYQSLVKREQGLRQLFNQEGGAFEGGKNADVLSQLLGGKWADIEEVATARASMARQIAILSQITGIDMPDISALTEEAKNFTYGGKNVGLAMEQLGQIGMLYDTLSDPNQFRQVKETLTDMKGVSKNRDKFISEGKDTVGLLNDFFAADLLEDTNSVVEGVNKKLTQTKNAVNRELNAERKNFSSNPSENPYSPDAVQSWIERAVSDYGMTLNQKPKITGNTAEVIVEKDGRLASIKIDDISGNIESSVGSSRFTGNETILGGVLNPLVAMDTGLVSAEEAVQVLTKKTAELKGIKPEVESINEAFGPAATQTILNGKEVQKKYGSRTADLDDLQRQIEAWDYFRDGLAARANVSKSDLDSSIQQHQNNLKAEAEAAYQERLQSYPADKLMEAINKNTEDLLNPNKYRQYDNTYKRATTDRTQEGAMKGLEYDNREDFLRAQQKMAQDQYDFLKAHPAASLDKETYAKMVEPMYRLWDEQQKYMAAENKSRQRSRILEDSGGKSVEEAAESWFQEKANSEYYKNASWRNKPRSRSINPIDENTADIAYTEGDRRYVNRVSRPANDPGGNWEIQTISAQKVGTTTQDWFTGFGNKMKQLSQYMGSMMIMGYGMQQISSGINFVKTLDKGLTNIGMTMGATDEELQNLGATAIDTGKALSTDSSNVLSAMTVYANAGETAQSIAEKSKAAVMLSNVTGMSTEQTADMLQGATAQFGVNDQEALNTLEKISSELPLDFAKGITSMSDAITNAGSVAHESGLSMQEFAAITGEVGAVTRQEGSTIGNTLKTTMARISRSKSADEEVTGKDRSNAAQAYKDVLGYDLFDSNGEYKDLSETLGVLAGRWNTLTDAEKNFIAEQSAGTRGLNVFRTMMDNWGEIQRLATGALSDMSYADKNQEIWNDSLEGKASRLKASYQGMFNDILSADTMGFVSDVGSFAVGTLGQVTKGVDNVVSGLTGWMPFNAGSFLGDAAGMFALGGGIFSLMRTAAEYKGNDYSGLKEAFMTGFAPIVDPITDVTDIVKRSLAKRKAGREFDALEGSGVVSREDYINDALSTYGDENYGWLGKLISSSSDKSLKGLWDSFKTGLQNTAWFGDFAGATSGMTGLNKLLANVGRWALPVAALGVGAWAYNDITTAETKTRETATNAYNEKLKRDQTLQQTQAFYDQNAGIYTELAKGVNTRTNENISLTNDEYQRYLDLTNQIADQFPALTRGFDEQGNAILTTGNAIQSMGDSLHSQILENAYANLENGEDYGNAFKFDYDSTYHGESFWGKFASSVQRGWNDLWDGVNNAVGSTLPDSSKRGSLLGNIEALDKLNEVLPVLDGYDYQALTDAFKEADLINQGGRARDSKLWEDLGFDQLSQFADRSEDFYRQYAQVKQNVKAERDSLMMQAESDMAPLRSLMESQAQIMRYSDAYDFANLSDKDWSNLNAILRSTSVDQMSDMLDKTGQDPEEAATAYATKWANAFQAAGKDSKFSDAVSDVLSVSGTSSISDIRKALNESMGEIQHAMGADFDKELFKESLGLDDAEQALQKFGQLSKQLRQSGKLMDTLNESGKNWNKTVKDFGGDETRAFNARLEAFMDSRGVNSMDAMQNYVAVAEDLAQSGRLQNMDWTDLERTLDVQGFNADAFAERMELFASNVDILRDAQTNLSTFSQAARGVTGLDTSSLQGMASIFSEIDGFEFDKLFELGETGVRTNNDYLSYLNGQMKQLKEGQYDKEIESLQDRLENFNLEIGKNTDPTTRAQQVANRDLIQSSLDDLEMYRSQVQGLYSDTNQFLTSRQIGEAGSVYDQIAQIFSPKLNSKGEITAPAEIKQLYETGLIGTDEFRKAVQLTTGEDVSNWSEKQLVDQYNAKMEALYTMLDNNNPEQAYQTIMEQLRNAGLVEEGEKALVNGVERGTGNIIGDVQQLAHALGDINPDLVETIMGKVSDYGYEWVKPVTDASQAAQELFQQAEDAQNGAPLFSDVNLGVNSLEETNKQLETLNKHRDEAYSSGLGNQYEAIEDYLDYKKGGYLTAKDVDPFFEGSGLTDEEIGKLDTFTNKLNETREMDFSNGIKQFKQLHQELSGIEFENMKNWSWQEWADAFSQMSTDQIKELMDLTGIDMDGSQIEEVIALLDQAVAAKEKLEQPGSVNVSADGFSAEADKGRKLYTTQEVNDAFGKGYIETPNKFNSDLYRPQNFVGKTIGEIEEQIAKDYEEADQLFSDYINGGAWPENPVAQDLIIRNKSKTNGRFSSADSIQKAIDRGYLAEDLGENFDLSKVNMEALQGMKAREIEAALKYLETGSYPVDGFGKVDADSRKGVLTYKSRTGEALTADEIKNAVTDGIIQAPEGMELSNDKINNKDWSPYEGMTAEQATQKLANDLQSEKLWKDLSTARTDSLKGFRGAEEKYANQVEAKAEKDSQRAFREYEQEQRQTQAVEKAKQDMADKRAFRQYEENTEAGAGQKQYVTKEEREAQRRRSQPKKTEPEDIVNQDKATLSPGEIDKINKGQKTLGDAWNSLMSLFGLGPKGSNDKKNGFQKVEDSLETSQKELTKSGAKVAETANTVQQQQKQTQKQQQAVEEAEEAPQPKSSKSSSKGKVQFSEEIQAAMDAENERRAAAKNPKQPKSVPRDQVQFSDEILAAMEEQNKRNAAAGGKVAKQLEEMDFSDKIKESLEHAGEKTGESLGKGNFFDGIFGGIGDFLSSLFGLDVKAATYEDGELAGTPQHSHEIGKQSVADQNRGFRELESEEVEVPVKTGEVDTSSIDEVEEKEVTVNAKTEFSEEEPADQLKGFRELEGESVEVPVKTGDVDTSSVESAAEGKEIPVDAKVQDVDTSGLEGIDGKEIPVNGKVEDVDTSALDGIDAKDIRVDGVVEHVDDSAITALDGRTVTVNVQTNFNELSPADQMRNFRAIEQETFTAEGTVNWKSGEQNFDDITTDGTVNWQTGSTPSDVTTEGRVNWNTGSKNFEQPMKTTGLVDWTSGARNFGDMTTQGTVNWITGTVDHPTTDGTVNWVGNNTIPVTGIGTVQWDNSDPGFGPFTATGTVTWTSVDPEPPAKDVSASVNWDNVYQMLQVSNINRSVIWSNVYSGPPAVSDQHHYIYWENVETGSRPSGGSSKANGTAFLSGSALASGSVDEEDPKKKRRLMDRIASRISGKKEGDAQAKGNWGLKKSGVSLVGELGRELVVRGSKWFTIGDHGAEMRNLQKGDIVFNHKQTEEIFNKGKAISGGGRGKQVGGALSEGTAYANGLPTSRFKNYDVWNSYYNWLGFQGMSDFTAGKNYRGMASEVDMRQFLSEIYNTTDALNVMRNSAVDMSAAFNDGSTIMDYVAQALNRMTQEISKIDTLFTNTWISIPQRMEYGMQELGMLNQQKQLHKESRDKYWQAARAIGLDENTMKLAKEGSIDVSVLTDQALAKKIQQFMDLYNKGREEELAMMQSQNSIIEQISTMSELRLQPFVNNVEGFESQANQAANKIDIVHAKGHFASREFYVDQYDSLQEQLAAQEELMTAKQVELENLVNAGLDRNSQEFADRVKDLQAENEAWQQIKTSIYECENAMEQEQNDLFDWVQDQVNNLHEENEFIRDVFGTFEDNMFAKSSGRFNINGGVVVATHAMDYAMYQEQAEELAREEAALKEKLYNDKYFNGKVDKDTLDRYNEVHKMHEQAITDSINEKKAIQDLYREQYDHMLEVLDKVIDKKKEQLEAEKDLYDYQKKIQNQVDDINELQKIYLSLENDDSEEGKARRQEVKNDLDEAQEELEEMEYEQWLTDQERIMDDYRQAAEDTFNERLDHVDELLEEANGLLENDWHALDKLGWDTEGEKNWIENSKEDWNQLVKDNINGVTGELGITLNDDLKKLYDDVADPAVRNLTSGFEGLQTTIGTVNKDLWSFTHNLSQAATLLDPTKLHSEADHQWENEVNTMPDPVKQTTDYYAGKTAQQQAAAQQQQQAAPTVTGNYAVGTQIRAVYPGTNNPSPIYASSTGGTGWNQAFSSDPQYVVMGDYGEYILVKWYKVLGNTLQDCCGYFKKTEVTPLATGGYTGNLEGLAYLHPQEMVLNQRQFSNFSRLTELIPIVVDQFKRNSILGTITDGLLDSVKTESNDNHSVNNNNNIEFNITMNDVQNPEQFVNELRTNREVIRAINDITEAKLTKNSKLGQRKGLSAL